MDKAQAPQVGAKVKKKELAGCFGIVKEVREEVIGSSGDTRDKALIVKVQWDNGTVSFFAPEALEQIQ